jgi:hypothetical protein
MRFEQGAERFIQSGDDRSGRIPMPREGRAVPAWPRQLIAPSGTELERWTQLWHASPAFAWHGQNRERAVATLIRLENRCAQSRVDTRYVAELRQLRDQLGLAPDPDSRLGMVIGENLTGEEQPSNSTVRALMANDPAST